jgi:hypothetical protein
MSCRRHRSKIIDNGLQILSAIDHNEQQFTLHIEKNSSDDTNGAH